MIDREVNELLKDTTICADIRWVPHRERLSEVSGRYLMSIKNDYEQIHSKPALPPADVVPVVHGHWIPYRCDMYECSVCKCIYTSFDSERCDADYCPHCGSFNGGKNEA